MCDLLPSALQEDPAEHLKHLIKQLIKEKQYDGVILLFTSSREAARNIYYMPKIAMDLFHEVCRDNISDKIYNENLPLYNCAEKLLAYIAVHAPPAELLIELLAIIEGNKNEFVFTSALKALQIVLLRHGDQKPRALEWSLNAIIQTLTDLPIPDYIKEGYDDKQKPLLEQDDKIQNLLVHYVTVGFFYQRLVDGVCIQLRQDKEIFRPVNLTKRNIYCCFLVKLLGKPLSLLDLSNDDEKKTNKYSLQCALSLTKGITKCIEDPLFLLSFVEMRSRFKRRPNKDKSELSSSNIFLIDKKLPLDCVAIYYYMVIVEDVCKNLIPKVYHRLYIMETCLYLVYELLSQNEPALHEKAILFMDKLLKDLENYKISASSLDLEVHKNVFNALCNIVGYSSHTQIRQMGIKTLRNYILSFEDDGKYVIIKNLLKCVQHDGICGYLAILYKDLVAKALQNSTELPPVYCGTYFRSLLLESICRLPKGVETDLLENGDKITSSLNVIRFFAMKDVNNRTGFWNFRREIEENYLNLLAKSLNLSIAHFNTELHNVESGVVSPQLDALNMLDINITNDRESNLNLELNPENRKHVLKRNLCTFDLMRALMSLSYESLERKAQ